MNYTDAENKSAVIERLMSEDDVTGFHFYNVGSVVSFSVKGCGPSERQNLDMLKVALSDMFRVIAESGQCGDFDKFIETIEDGISLYRTEMRLKAIRR